MLELTDIRYNFINNKYEQLKLNCNLNMCSTILRTFVNICKIGDWKYYKSEEIQKIYLKYKMIIKDIKINEFLKELNVKDKVFATLLYFNKTIFYIFLANISKIL